MDYYDLKSILAAQKSNFAVKSSTESFEVAPKREQPFIPPKFEKVAFEQKRPAVILISAVGATGKSTLAQVLSFETQLPLLDLAKHKPVGDNTLTGLITSAFKVSDLSNIFEGLGKGTYGVLIDGIDEGRSKTTEKAFEAFLDDIAKLCLNSRNTSFVLLGRTQILEDCWVYLTDRKINAGLVSISAFDLESARKYIDAFTGKIGSSHETQYKDVRELILGKLGSAFSTGTVGTNQDFLSFIGYPPVLDAIATLLRQETNYHRLRVELEGPDSGNVETDLLFRIAVYILRREKEQKVEPNIVRPLIAEMPATNSEAILRDTFGAEEQCIRLIAYCLSKPISLDVIKEPLINEKYEQQLSSWLHEHPFLEGHKIRNAVFESVALATLIGSRKEDAIDLALEYSKSHKFNYHLIYFLNAIASGAPIPINSIHIVVGSALEFRSTATSIELNVEVKSADAVRSDQQNSGIVRTEVEIFLGKERQNYKSFAFTSNLGNTRTVFLGNRLSSAYISLPCSVSLSGAQELELTAPVVILADTISLQSSALVLRHLTPHSQDDIVLFDAKSIDSTITSIITNGVDLVFSVSRRDELTYPAAKFFQERVHLPEDPLLKEKFLRLKRILMSFRSHSRGTLARYKHMIENDMIAGNETGKLVLSRLLAEKIITLSGNFYFLDPANVDKHLGISWADLRKGHVTEKLFSFIQSIN